MFRLAKHSARLNLQFVALSSLLALANLLLPFKVTHADPLASRSIQISSAQPSVIATHTFELSPVTAGNLGSIVFEYCDSPVFAYPCNAPPGLDLTSAVLSSQTGNGGFSIDNGSSAANKLVLTRSP